MKKHYKILRIKDNKLVGLSRNPMKLCGYKFEEINEGEYKKLKFQLWKEINS